MPTMLVRLPGKRHCANIIDPGFEVRLLGLARGVTGPGHHDLCRACERQESFAATNADRLKIGDFLRDLQRIHCLAAMSIASRQGLRAEIGEFRFVRSRDPQAEADMKGDGKVHVGNCSCE